MTDEWITTSEAAEISGYHAEHLRELIRDNKILGQKFGIVWQVSRRSLDAYLAAAQKSGDKRRGQIGYVPALAVGDTDITDYHNSGGRLHDWLESELSRDFELNRN